MKSYVPQRSRNQRNLVFLMIFSYKSQVFLLSQDSMFLFFFFFFCFPPTASLLMPFFLWYCCFLSFIFRVSKENINWQSKVCMFHLLKLTIISQCIFAIVISLWMRNVTFDHELLLGMRVWVHLCFLQQGENIMYKNPQRNPLWLRNYSCLLFNISMRDKYMALRK